MGHPEQSVASGRAGPSAPKERKWLPTLSVLVVVVVVSLGGLVAVGETQGTLAQTDLGTDPGGEPRKPVVVLGSVTITPLRGWEEAERFEKPEGVRLTKGVATLDAVGLPFQGTPEDLFEAYVSDVLTSEASQLQSAKQLEIVHLDVGFTAVRGFYFGVFGERNAQIEGELTTVLIPEGIGIVLDGWAETGSYQFLRHEVNQMIQRMQVS